MNLRKTLLFSLEKSCFVLVQLFLLHSMILLPSESRGDESAPNNLPFHPGEKLTYLISWSNVFNAGTAVMEVRKDASAEGEPRLKFISTARSTGMVDKFYRVDDYVHSVYDPIAEQSISYHSNQSHGKRKKQREMVFDRKQRKVVYTQNGHQEVIDVPEHTQDALSSLYYLRSRENFTQGKPIIINVHDGGKTWSVEIYVLGKEKVKTPAGEFDTIKVKTYPKYEGVFLHKGEIFIWLTDDKRKVPVLMKSTISIGSIVATLTEMISGDSSL